MTYRKPPFLLRKWQQLQMRYYAYRNPEKLVRIRSVSYTHLTLPTTPYV